MWHVGNEYGPTGATATGGRRLPPLAARAVRRRRRAQRGLGNRVLEPALRRLGRRSSRRAGRLRRSTRRSGSTGLCFWLRRVPGVLRGSSVPPSRRPTPRSPTTNFMSLFPAASTTGGGRGARTSSRSDSYPDLRRAGRVTWRRAPTTTSRAASPAGGSWLLLEHATSAVDWLRGQPAEAPRPDAALGASQALARGSDGAMFFQWRAARAGPRSSTARWSRTPARTARVGQNTRASRRGSCARSPSSQGRAREPTSQCCPRLGELVGVRRADHPSSLGLSIQLVLQAWYGRFHQAERRGRVRPPERRPRRATGWLSRRTSTSLSDDSLAALAGVRHRRRNVLAVGRFSCRRRREDHIRAGGTRRSLLGAARGRVLAARSRRACRRALPLRRGGHGTRLGASGWSWMAVKRWPSTRPARSRDDRPPFATAWTTGVSSDVSARLLRRAGARADRRGTLRRGFRHADAARRRPASRCVAGLQATARTSSC